MYHNGVVRWRRRIQTFQDLPLDLILILLLILVTFSTSEGEEEEVNQD
jgi:hypothetical protein